MSRYSQNKILETALYQLKRKLISNNTLSRRKNDDGKKRETLFHVSKKSECIIGKADKHFPAFSNFKFNRLGVPSEV